MDSVFETRTFKLSLDLLKDFWPATRQTIKIIWDDVLFSHQFHTELTQKITHILKQEYGLISQDVYDGNKQRIIDLASKAAGDHAVNSIAVWKLEELGADLGKRFKEIEHHFDHTKAGIWIDEHENTATVIVSVLIIAGGYGLYSFRNTKVFETIVNGADLLGIANKSFHVGGVKLNGQISDYSVSKSTTKLSLSVSKKWKAIQAKAGSSGVVNFNTGKILKTTADVELMYPINKKLNLKSGLKNTIAHKPTKEIENTVYVQMNLTNDHNNFTLQCSVTDGQNSRRDKECSASATIKF